MPKQAQLPDGTILEFPDDTQDSVIDNVVKSHINPVKKDISKTEYLSNMLHGFAGRGNRAMAAINPWADHEKIAAEQEWIKQNEGAGIGSMLADMAITAPVGGLGSVPARILASGIDEGLTNPGSLKDRLNETVAGMAGAGLGEGIGSALGFIAKPFANNSSATQKKLVELADKMGIKLNAAQKTGNKTLQYADSALDFIPSSSSAQQEFKDAQRQKWQELLFKHGNQDINGIAPDEVMGPMKDRISGVYNDVSGRNNINIDQQLKDTLDALSSERNMNLMDVNKKPMIQQYLNDFNSAPVGAQISGSGYQTQRSLMDKQAKALINSNPAESQTLKDIRNALDEAMTRSASPEDAAMWKGANKDWMTMKNIESAIDPTTGQVSPAKLMSTLARKDPNRVIYGNGDQELTNIAKVGKEFISPKTGDSGTAQRAAMMKLLTGAGALGGSANFAYSHDPESALGGAGAAALAAILLPKMAGSMMRNSDGYLANGLTDMAQEVLPGLTKQRALQELMRNVGLQSSANLYENK